MNWPVECVVIIPCLNEGATISRLVQSVRAQLPHVIVVDDGSTDATATLAKTAGAEVIRHGQTRGKGAALNSGWKRALELGFAWALTLDGDGQHAPEDIPLFLSVAEQSAPDLVVGNRMTDTRCMPWLRLHVNRWMSRRLSQATGRSLPDSQCGFRLMRLEPWSALALETTHFEIESEVLLAFAAAGFAIQFVPVKVIYKNECSKIHPLRDTLRWFHWWRRVRRHPSQKAILPKPACVPPA
jgi:glycosyltransferase involved in cell wall biosynthesis